MADEHTAGDDAPTGRSRRGLAPPAVAVSRVQRHRRILRVAAWAGAAAVVVGGSGLGFVYFKLNGNISGVDINAALGTDRPYDADNGSMDILVLGSDTRSGDNAEYGGGRRPAPAPTPR